MAVVAAADTSFDVYEAEKQSVLAFLAVNKNAQSNVPLWKVLLYDDRGRKIIAPLVKLGTLRQNGVTLNLLVHSERYQVPDAAAIYFVEPTDRNFECITSDIKNRLYKSYSIEFISPASEDQLKLFARKVGSIMISGATAISRVVDRYLDFISLSPSCFILDLPDTFSILYSARADEAKIQRELDKIVSGLISLIRTMNLCPIIQCPTNPASPARAVGTLLEQRLKQMRDHWQEGENWSSCASKIPSCRKPILILCDRSFDFMSMLAHTWTYQSLIHDVFGIESNRVTIDDGKKRRVYDLDPSDSFYSTHGALHYPEIAVAISELLEQFNKQLKSLNTGKTDLDSIHSDIEGDKLTTSVAQALNSAPEIISKKQSLDMHTNIAQALLQEIRTRSLDKFYEVEVSLTDTLLGTLQSAIQVCTNVEQILGDRSCGSIDDKYRLLLCLHLCKGQLTKAQIDKCASLVKAQSPDGKALNHLLALKFFRHYESMSQLRHDDTYGSLVAEAPIRREQSAFTAAAASLMDRSKGLLLQGIKHLMPLKQQWKVVQLCENLLDAKKSKIADSYVSMDPLNIPGDTKSMSTKKAIVFVVGGGTYVESEALNEYAEKSQKHIIYGSTSFIRPSDFLRQCETLGNQL